MKTIELRNARARKPEWCLAEPVNFYLDEGEHLAIVGRNGGGKSMLVDMITGKHPVAPDSISYSFTEPYNNLKTITFRDTYGGDNDRTYFLQQRWNQTEIVAKILLNAESSRSICTSSSTWRICLINISYF